MRELSSPRCQNITLKKLSPFFLLAVIIHTEVDVESLNPTNTLYRSGVGEQRVLVRGNLDPRDPRTATKWSFANAQEALRSAVVHLLRFKFNYYLGYIFRPNILKR